jgi:hypothetical protein
MIPKIFVWYSKLNWKLFYDHDLKQEPKTAVSGAYIASVSDILPYWRNGPTMTTVVAGIDKVSKATSLKFEYKELYFNLAQSW